MIKYAMGLFLAVLANLGLLNVAHAAIDVTSVVTEIQGALGPIGLIGGAVLIVIVSIAAYRWVRRAISG